MKSRLPELLKEHETAVLNEWIGEQIRLSSNFKGSQSELKTQCRDFLNVLTTAIQSGGVNLNAEVWSPVKTMLAGVSRQRSSQGFSPSETATFIFSLKQPLFSLLKREAGKNAAEMIDENWAVTSLLDQLGLYTFEVYQKAREEIIVRQQEDMLELSTPVVKLWDGVLALPMIGTLDSGRTQVVMEALLRKIMETGSEVAIVDITGVPTVDTLVAQHLIKTVTAARLMGAECIISGIRPQIAATIVHLGIDLSSVTTKANLADAFKVALSRTNRSVIKVAAGRSGQT